MTEFYNLDKCNYLFTFTFWETLHFSFFVFRRFSIWRIQRMLTPSGGVSLVVYFLFLLLVVAILPVESEIQHPLDAVRVGETPKERPPKLFGQGHGHLGSFFFGQGLKDTFRFLLRLGSQGHSRVVPRLVGLLVHQGIAIASHEGKLGAQIQRRVKNQVVTIFWHLLFHGRATVFHRHGRLGFKNRLVKGKRLGTLAIVKG